MFVRPYSVGVITSFTATGVAIPVKNKVGQAFGLGLASNPISRDRVEVSPARGCSIAGLSPHLAGLACVAYDYDLLVQDASRNTITGDVFQVRG